MAYTAAQLQQDFYLVAQGQMPDGATLQLIQTAAQQDSAGAISDRQTLAVALRSSQALNTTDVAAASYQFFTGAFPSQAGLSYLVNNPGSGFNTIYYNGAGTATAPGPGGFNQENRYFNEAVALAEDPNTGSQFRTTYASLTLAQTVALAYEAIIGTASVGAPAAQAAVASIAAAIPYFAQVAQERAGGVDVGGQPGQNVALKAIIVGYIIEEALKADVGVYAQAMDQFNAAIAAGNAGYATPLNAYQPAGIYYGKGVGATVYGFSTPMALTTGVDTISSAASDVIYTASAGQSYVSGPKPTLNAGDSIITTGKNTALLLTDTVGGSNVTSGVSFSGFSQVLVQNTAPSTVADTVVDASQLANVGIITDYLSTGGVQINNIGAGVTIDVNNANITTTHPDVSLNYAPGVTAATICLGLNDPFPTTPETKVEVAGAGLGVLTVDIAGATSLTVAGSTASPSVLNVLATGQSNIDLGASSSISSINALGNSFLNLSVSSAAIQSVTSSDAEGFDFTDSAASPTVNLTSGSGGFAYATFTQGLSASSSVVFGRQGSSLTISGPFGDGAVLTGGGGSTLTVDAADLMNELNYSHLDRVTGFSTIQVSTPLPNGSLYDFTKLSVNTEQILGVVHGGTASIIVSNYNNLHVSTGLSTSTDGTLIIQVGTGSSLATLPQNTADSLNLDVGFFSSGVTGLHVSTLGVETVNLSSDGGTGVASQSFVSTVFLSDPALRTLYLIDGSISFASTSDMTSLRTVDASAPYSGADIINVFTATPTAPVTIIGSSEADIIGFGDDVTVRGNGSGSNGDTYDIGVISNVANLSTILDEAKGDHIVFAGLPATFGTVAITLTSGATLQQLLNAAAAKPDYTISYFVFGGDTYVVDTGPNGGATFANGIDTVVKLTGVHDLSHSTLANGVLTTSG